MATKRVHWKREPKKRATSRLESLTPEEQECVRVALRVLLVRYGTWVKVAEVLGVPAGRLYKVHGKHGPPTAGLALRVARVAGVAVDDVLEGKFPADGSCPMCGRSKLGHYQTPHLELRNWMMVAAFSGDMTPGTTAASRKRIWKY